MEKSNFKNKALYSILVLGLFSLAGVGIVSANNGGQGFRGFRDGGRGMRGGGIMMGELITNDMREGFREDMKLNIKNLTKEERNALKEKHHSQILQKQAEFESFTGLTRTEMRDLRQSGGTIGEVLISNGKTQADAEVFLTKQANDRIDSIVERHGLSSSEEATLRSKVSGSVQNIIDRWFVSL